MRNLGFELNKSTILNRLNQYSIFAKYLEIDEDRLVYHIVNKKNMFSPFREEESPSVGFMYSDPSKSESGKTDFERYGQLRMRDFAASEYQRDRIFWGDCFDLVGLILGYNSKDPLEFNKILLDIAVRFDLINGEEKDIELPKLDLSKFKNRITIDVQRREWNDWDKAFWNKNLISTALLNRERVYPVWRYWIERERDYIPNYIYNNPKDPCYAFYTGKGEDGIKKIKLYFPYRRKELRYLSNNNDVAGLDDITEGDNIIIAKSYKDRLTLLYIFFYTGSDIKVLGLPSENHRLDIATGIYIYNKFKSRYVFADYDLEGIKLMNYYKREYNFIPIFFKENKPVKDISDYASRYGLDNTINLFKTCKLFNYEPSTD